MAKCVKSSKAPDVPQNEVEIWRPQTDASHTKESKEVHTSLTGISLRDQNGATKGSFGFGSATALVGDIYLDGKVVDRGMLLIDDYK
jgi:hypothetical protein